MVDLPVTLIFSSCFLLSDRLQFSFQYNFNRTNKNHNFYAVPTIVSIEYLILVFVTSFSYWYIKFRSIQFSSEQFSSVQNNSVQFISVQSIQSNSVQFNSVQFSSVQFISVHFSSVQFSSIQFSSVQYSSVQFSSTPSPNNSESDSMIPLAYCKRLSSFIHGSYRYKFYLHILATHCPLITWFSRRTHETPMTGTICHFPHNNH